MLKDFIKKSIEHGPASEDEIAQIYELPLYQYWPRRVTYCTST